MSRRITIASLIWGFSILLSRMIGLVREAVIGRVLGGGHEADAFWTAFVIPDFLNYLLAGGALSIVFIPIFGGYLARGAERSGWESFSRIANLLVLILGIVMIILWFSVPVLANIVAPGFDSTQTAKLILLTRIVLPAQIFHIIGGLLSAALQARDRHILPALAPLIYTSCIVAGGLIGGREAGAFGFAWGVVAGSVLGPFGLPLIGCLRMKMAWYLRVRLFHSDVRAYLLRSLPIMLAWSIVVVDDWFLRRFGSLIGEGAISTLQYAKTLMKVPMGVFGLAAGVAAYPTLTRLLARGENQEAYRTMSGAIRHMLVLAFGSQVILTCAGPEIARVIYGNRLLPGQHTAIGIALGILSLSLWAWAAQTLAARGFYAMGNTWIPPVLGTAVALAAYPLYGFLGNQYGINGLATATSIAISTYVILLLICLRKRFDNPRDRMGAFFLRILPPLMLAIGSGLLYRKLLTPSGNLLSGFTAALIGAVIFIGTGMLTGLQEMRTIMDRIIFRIRGTT
ncbi:murein biosynthesis integral membrane protein MurJ [bacterium]|nr:murein biosynthesis integral membrane protein MurJ [candidate division CSSED10-310 bacterium]